MTNYIELIFSKYLHFVDLCEVKSNEAASLRCLEEYILTVSVMYGQM